MNSKIDRRSAPRTLASVPVRVSGANGKVEVDAQTRDISTNGVFLYTNSRMAEGSDIELVLILPAEVTAGEKYWVCCQARVLRVEQVPGEKFGVAAEIRRMNFLPEISA